MYIIAGSLGKRRLAVPKGLQTRPTASRLRESLFNICQQVIEGANFLDLYAGSGAVGLEALSRGASSVTFIESHPEAILAIRENVKLLKVEKQCTILPLDVFVGLKKLKKINLPFDIIFADPPYKTLLDEKNFHSFHLIEWLDQNSLLKSGGLFFIEEDHSVEIPEKGFQTLTFKNSRKMGPASLHQFCQH